MLQIRLGLVESTWFSWSVLVSVCSHWSEHGSLYWFAGFTHPMRACLFGNADFVWSHVWVVFIFFLAGWAINILVASSPGTNMLRSCHLNHLMMLLHLFLWVTNGLGCDHSEFVHYNLSLLFLLVQQSLAAALVDPGHVWIFVTTKWSLLWISFSSRCVRWNATCTSDHRYVVTAIAERLRLVRDTLL